MRPFHSPYNSQFHKTPFSEIKSFKQQIHAGENPKDYKLKLAHGVVEELYSIDLADQAKIRFIDQFAKKKNQPIFQFLIIK